MKKEDFHKKTYSQPGSLIELKLRDKTQVWVRFVDDKGVVQGARLLDKDTLNTLIQILSEAHEVISNPPVPKPLPTPESSLECLEARFSELEQSTKDFQQNTSTMFNVIKTDIKDLTTAVQGLITRIK